MFEPTVAAVDELLPDFFQRPILNSPYEYPQHLDPARVDGLARVLDTATRDRQVVVFTHDDPQKAGERSASDASVKTRPTRGARP